MTNIKSRLFSGDNQYIPKLFKFMRPRAISYAITQVVYSAQGFAMPFIFSIFLANVMAAILAGNREALATAGIQLAIMLGGYLFLFLVMVYINILIVERTTMDLRLAIFRKFMQTGIEDASHSGEGIATLNTDTDTAADIFSGPVMMLLMSIITIVGATVVVFTHDWRLGLATLAVGITSFIMQKRFTKPLAEIGKQQLDVNAEAVKSVSNIFSGAMAIRTYNMQPQAYLTFDKENKRLRALGFRQGFITMGQNLFRTVEGWLTLISVFGLGGWLAATGRIEFYTIAAVFVMSSSLSSAIGSLGANYAGLQPPLAGAKRVFAILDKPDITTKKAGSDTPAKGHALHIKDFTFRYQDGATDVLQNINLTIPENQMVALVGESGSGKSTLLRAIMGMYERETMPITLGDLPFDNSSLKNWRSNFAYVDQTCKLFDMTIKENIAMGLMGNATDAAVIEAAKKAQIHDFIESLEDGYNTPCGENGASLSGGQKQRIAIARALIKNAPVLLFDEATSALDAETEAQIMDTIHSLRGQHTIIYTTHHLKYAKLADVTVTLAAGKVQK